MFRGLVLSRVILGLSGLSLVELSLKKSFSGGVVRTKVVASSGRRWQESTVRGKVSVVRTKVRCRPDESTRDYFFQLQECRPYHVGGSSGRRSVVRTTRPFRPDEGRTTGLKFTEKGIFRGNPGYTVTHSYNPSFRTY